MYIDNGFIAVNHDNKWYVDTVMDSIFIKDTRARLVQIGKAVYKERDMLYQVTTQTSVSSVYYILANKKTL